MKTLKSFAAISISFVFAVSGLTIEVPSAQAAAISVPVTASSLVLMDSASNQVVYAKNSHTLRAPASTTKILTAIVAYENASLDRLVTVPQFVVGIEPSKANLRPGERYYIRDLIKATLISSANDAAETLAHVIGGSRANFAQMMNQKARAIGCLHSRFVRASGLPAEDQYSTAFDMALIAKESYRYPFLVQVMKIRTVNIYSADGRAIYLKNHNKLLMKGHDELIGKTGWTRNAKHCFVGLIDGVRKTYIAMLGSKKMWQDLSTIISYQFGHSFRPVKANKKTGAAPAVETKKLQLALKRAGVYRGPVNGVLGPITRKAVKTFQKSRKLPVTGTAGPQTIAALRPYLS